MNVGYDLTLTAQKMKFSINGFFIFCAVTAWNNRGVNHIMKNLRINKKENKSKKENWKDNNNN